MNKKNVFIVFAITLIVTIFVTIFEERIPVDFNFVDIRLFTTPLLVCLIGYLILKEDFTRKSASALLFIDLLLCTFCKLGWDLSLYDPGALAIVCIYIAISTSFLIITRRIIVLKLKSDDTNKQQCQSNQSAGNLNKSSETNFLYVIKMIFAIVLPMIATACLPAEWRSGDERLIIVPLLVCLIGLLFFGKDFTRKSAGVALYADLYVCTGLILYDNEPILLLIYASITIVLRTLLVLIVSAIISMFNRQKSTVETQLDAIDVEEKNTSVHHDE